MSEKSAFRKTVRDFNKAHGPGVTENLINRYDKYLQRQFAPKNKGVPFLKYAGKPELSNMFTGVKPTILAKGLAIGGALAYGFASGAINVMNRGEQAARANAQDVGSAGFMSYDAVGNVSGGRRDLGATGDLVFALHKNRRG